MTLTSLETVTSQLLKSFPEIPSEELKEAAKTAWDEMDRCRQEMFAKGQETLDWMTKHNRRGIVLAGRPYHIDNEINHGIPELINSYGIAVLTEDSISNLNQPERPLIAMDQWMYHSRLDAVTTDAVGDILSRSGKIYTCLKIDEVNNLGAARIRIRSLIAAIRVREQKQMERKIVSSSTKRIVSLGNQTGEGWFLTGEMLELIHDGISNIVCTQPFGCLPNHVVGKGVIKEIRHQYPMANIAAIDYDPGASEVNQLNRIKLMIASAVKNLNLNE